ncbi:hypothetical protein EDD15DRAFT_2384724 [Pisolithus albus]|nr:hypothetical protein EDD15DRAFT_2384724 [Pisolithus albus]
MPVCPKCLKYFQSARGVTFHQAQPRAVCNVRDDRDTELVSAAAAPANERVNHEVDDALLPPSPPEFQPMDLDPDPAWEGRVLVTFPHASEIFEGGETFLTRFELDPYSVCRRLVPFYPFANLDDWRVANFLLTSGLSMRALDEFLSLEATKNMPLSFWTAKDLRARAELLPSGPRWKFQIIPTTHPTREPALFNHPFFADKMDFTPFWLFTTAEHLVRVFTEWMSSDGAWDMQHKIPEGATICGIILSSDKTNITNMCGGKVAHPLLISLANIKMKVRNKGCSHAFLLLALMPIPQFIHPVRRMCGVLEERLFHQCLDIVLEPLKQAARLATTLAQLASIECDVLNVDQYFAACERFRLNGVSHPFWRDWPLAEPSEFLTPESLHEWHRQFWDHDVRWCKHAWAHFPNGITKAQRDIQRYIVVVIAATTITSITRDKIRASLQEFHDHKDTIIQNGHRRGEKTKQVLRHWHIPKLELMQSVALSIERVGSILQWSADTTEHAHIEVIKDPASTTNNHSYDTQICRSLDRSEKCRLFDTALALRGSTSEPTSMQQLGQETNDSDSESSERDKDRSVFFDVAVWLSVSPPDSVPRPLCTFIARSTAIHLNYDPSLKRVPIDIVAERFKLPDLRGALGDYLNREGNVTQNFHTFGGQRRSPLDVHLPFKELHVWYKVRLQQKAYHDPSDIASTFTVHAHPPDCLLKYGRYDTAIMNVDDQWQWPSSGLQGHAIVHVRLIMCPVLPRGSSGVNWFSDHFLIYAQRFDIVPQGNSSVERTTGLHVLKKAMRASGSELGEVFPLDQLRSYAHVVLRFGRKADNHLTSTNCIHSSLSFFLNKYFEKDFFYAIS